MTVYHTHDNGSRPFRVTITDVMVKIQFVIESNNSQNEPNKYPNFPILMFEQPKKVYVGKSQKSEFTERGGDYGPQLDGNSILIEQENNQYIFIGESIYSFKSKEPIIEFQSPVGRNDVPYPWAKDLQGNYYLLSFSRIFLPYEEDLDDKISKIGSIEWYVQHQQTYPVKCSSLPITKIIEDYYTSLHPK